MSQISLQVPQIGLPNSSEDVKVANDMTVIQNAINGNLDATNISATLAQSAAVNQSGQTVKGASVIGATETRTNTAYGTMPTADQVTVVLQSNGLIEVSYWATWQESVAGAARAAIFIGANQLKVANGAAQQLEAAATNSATAAVNLVLLTAPFGIVSQGFSGASYSGDVTTGQALSAFGTGIGVLNAEVNGAVTGIPGNAGVSLGLGGALLIDNLPAGTYAISVQFKASSGSVTASNRRLRVRAHSFA